MNYLREAEFKEEFSHTILHNQSIFDKVQNKLRDRVNSANEDEEAKVIERGQPGQDIFHPPETVQVNEESVRVNP